MVTFRIDDVSSNTDMIDLNKQIELLSLISDKIYLGVNILSRRSDNGSVYPDLPLRGHDRIYFYSVNQILSLGSIKNNPKIELVSHGLIHGVHSQYSRDANEMSILTSCSLLKTNKFIPPFNEVNEETKSVCLANGIEIIGNNHDRIWKSLESEPFDSRHKFWYYHPWRLNSNDIAERIKI